MKVVTGPRVQLERRLKQRGATWESIRPAIVGDPLADPISVDVEHDAYPKPILLIKKLADPVPVNEWPKWATWSATQRKPEDTGVGDTVRWMLAGFGGEVIKGLLASFGIPCGCEERQAEWNQKYPYPAA